MSTENFDLAAEDATGDSTVPTVTDEFDSNVTDMSAQLNVHHLQAEKIIRLGDNERIEPLYQFEKCEEKHNTFYKIEGTWWQLGYLGSDEKGIFASFYRTKGEFKGYQT